MKRRFSKATVRLPISIRLLIILLLILSSGQPGRGNPAHVRAAEDLPAASLAPAVAADAYWSVETVDPGSGKGRYTSVVIDSADHLHVSYQDTSKSALCYATFDGSTWVTMTVDNSGNVGMHTSIDLDSDEYPHISHYESESGLRHAYWNGTAWVNEAVDYSSDVGEYSSLGVSSTSDDIYIGYYDASNQSLKVARFYMSTWMSGTLDVGPGVGRYTALATARYPQLVYYDIINDQLKYAEMDISGWDFSNSPVNAAGDGGMYASLALDSNNDPRVSYFDNTNNELVYAHHTGTSWTNRMIDTVGSTVVQTAIAVDGNDYAHIAYYDDVGGDLRYAAFNGSVWVTKTIDSSGVLGYPAIDIDSNGYPHIAYQTTAGLKHAWLHPAPDLVVTDIWYDESNQLWYQVHNVGLGSAPAGHEVSLSIDGVGSGTDTIPTTLAPKERYSGSLTPWSCSGISDTVRILVDRTDVITETDETNNSREETWLCDPVPPQITWGPTPTAVSTDSAVIRWGTDESSDSRVTYDQITEQYGSSEYAAADVTAHQVTLTGLTPGSVYQYTIESTDPSGNTVSSAAHVFETASLPSDVLTGTVSVARVSDDYDIYAVTAVISPSALLDQAADTTMKDLVAPDHVEFYVNDQFIGTTYSGTETGDGQLQYVIDFHPYNVGITRTTWERTTHVFKAYVVYSDRTVGKPITGEFAPVSAGYTADVAVLVPINDWVYYTDEGGELPPGATIDFAVQAVQYEWMCDLLNGGNFIDPPDCESVSEEVDAVEFYVDDQLVYTSTSSTQYYIHHFVYDAEGLDVGPHLFHGVAITSDGARHTSYKHTISVEHGSPSLDVERTVTRNGNFFEVALTISLDAGASGPAYLYSLEDYVEEMMPVQQETPTYTLSSKYPIWMGDGERTARITIDFTANTNGDSDWITLIPGHSHTIVYQLVPILYEDGQANPSIGNRDLSIAYWYDGVDVERDLERYWYSLSSPQAAVQTADYILVTNPDRLLSLYCDEEVNDLLSSMAHLAMIRNGVIGFLENYYGSDERLRDLTSSGGYWAEALHPDFLELESGYMLIVGETEIVPAWTNYNFDICWNIPDSSLYCSKRDNDVRYHDQWYSSRSATSLKPHLIVGRIIGNTAAHLEWPIRTSIGVYEGQSGYEYQVAGRALLASGYGKFEQEKYWFDGHVKLVGYELDNNNGVADWNVEVLTLTQVSPNIPLSNSLSSGVSLLHLMGHGSVDGWADALSTGNPPNFYGYSPFVFAPSCLTGNYEAGDDYNLAESLFDQGIAVYIGSTQVSPVNVNMQMGLWFYKHDWNWGSDESTGRAFVQLEKDFYDEWSYYDWYKFWIAEYNYYGDPKFGASDPTPLDAAYAAMAPLTPTTSLNIQVPTYVVTATVDGFDQVEIPGGKMILEEGRHEIPYWTTSIDYAPGYRVQGVDLTLRSGQALTTGLNLPVASMTHSALVAPAADSFTQTLTLTEDDEWFVPLDQVYDWHVTQNPDGSSTLTIQVFPFHYQPATTNVEWYDTFGFEIDVISTTVAVDHFSLDKATYAPGETVQAEMWLSNGGDAQDVILVPTIRNLVTGEVIDGEELDALHDVSGAYAYYSFEWDNSGFALGQYVLWVDVLDAEGNLLYTTGEMFQLGSTSAEVMAFEASDNIFQPGDGIDLSLTVSNTGHMPINGEAVILVQTAGGMTTTATFTHTVTGLVPDGTLVLEDTWDTTGIAQGDYRVLGYVKYEAKSTEIETLEVTTQKYIYLPLVVTGGP